MIKINLLKALKENPVSTSESLNESPNNSLGFLAKLFPKNETENSEDQILDGVAVNQLHVILKVVLMLSVVVGLFIHESINIPRLEGILSQENAKLRTISEYNSKAASLVAEIKKQKENKAIIEKQIASLNGLSKVRLKYIKALELIQTNIPEKMWFDEMVSKGDTLTTKGIANSENEITKFLSDVGRSVYFTDVSMISSEDTAIKGNDIRKLKKFHINFILEENK